MSDLGTKFAEEAALWADKKVPYLHRGETDRGCDCTGIIIGILTKFGKLKNYKRVKYKIDWNVHENATESITKELLRIGDFVENGPEPGDILLFKFGRCSSHSGIFVGGNKFVHSTGGGQGCCRYGILKNSQWSRRLSGVIRLNENKIP